MKEEEAQKGKFELQCCLMPHNALLVGYSRKVLSCSNPHGNLCG